MPDEKSRFRISTDELESRMEKKKKLHDEPIQQAVEILTGALYKVMTSLGVDIEQDIPAQQEALGIIITELARENLPKINGYYIFLKKAGDLDLYSWVGDAYLNNLGECFCNIWWEKKGRLEEFGGVKVIH